MPEPDGKSGRYVLALVVMGALGRLLMAWLHFPWGPVPKDGSYTQAAQNIFLFNFHALGDRVPVYPLFVALCGLNSRAIWGAQALLGVAASLMIFDLAFRRTHHALFSLFVGLASSLIPEVLTYEAGIMAETLTNFLLVSSLWLIARCDDAGEGNIQYPLALGSIVALASLTRPLMMCLVPVYYCFLILFSPPAQITRRENTRKTLAFSLPVIVFVLGWCIFNYYNSGYLIPATRSGQQLMDQVDPYVELAPDRFAVLRDAWLEARAQVGPDKPILAIYQKALPEMERRTGKTEIQISPDLASLALYLEIHHPLLCLRRAEQGWIQFWGEPLPDEGNGPGAGKMSWTELVMPMADFLIRESKAAFLVLALLSIPCAVFRPKVFAGIEYLAFAMTLWVSVFAAFTEYGENRRFCVPFYMLIVYTLLTRVWVWISATATKRAGSNPA